MAGKKNLCVTEILDALENEEEGLTRDIFIEPPEVAQYTDEDSADEDDGGLIENLNGRQLQAPATLARSLVADQELSESSDDENLSTEPPRKKQKISQNMKRSRYSRTLYTMFLITMLWALAYIVIMFGLNHQPKYYPNMVLNRKIIQDELRKSVRMEKGTGCNMPEIDPFSKEALKFNENVDKIECNNVDWVECYKDECFIVDTAKTADLDVQCTLMDIIHVNDLRYDLGEPRKLKRNETYKLVSSDAVKVSCIGRSKSGIDLLPLRWFGYKSGFRRIQERAPVKKNPQSIMIFAFDSTSRAGFMRSMPQSYKMLKSMGFVVLKSYNVIGDGTSAALFPILTGRNDFEFSDLRTYGSRNRGFFNNSDFIFDKARSLGYRTAYFEDMPWVGTFQFRFNGFKEQPADHYTRSLLMAEFGNGKKWYKGFSEKHCIGGTPVHSFLLNITEQFLNIPGTKLGFMFISGICHDKYYLISVADEEFANLLKRFNKDRNLLANTTFIVMGDHGTRFSAYRKTYQGKIEERLPLMAIRLSDHLSQNTDGVRSLESNIDVLTTPFDVHATLLDIMQLQEQKSTYKVEGSDLLRSMSLLNPIPPSRSCGEAGIQPHWCACSKWHTMKTSDFLYYRVVNSLVYYINNLTKEIRHDCAKRDLAQIYQVQRFSPDKRMLRFKKSLDVDGLFADFSENDDSLPKFVYYQATFSVKPGKATFEGTVVYDTEAKNITVTEHDISRIDAYGDESKCIKKDYPNLSKYCYCVNYSKLRRYTPDGE